MVLASTPLSSAQSLRTYVTTPIVIRRSDVPVRRTAPTAHRPLATCPPLAVAPQDLAFTKISLAQQILMPAPTTIATRTTFFKLVPVISTSRAHLSYKTVELPTIVNSKPVARLAPMLL